MGRNKRKLIEWVEPKNEPAKPSVAWSYYKPEPYHIQFENLLREPGTRSNAYRLATVLNELVIEASLFLKKHPLRNSYYTKSSIVKSLRYVCDNFYIIEDLINKGTMTDLPKKGQTAHPMNGLDYMHWLTIIEALEPVGFDFPRIKQRLLVWRLQNEHAQTNPFI